MFYLMSVLSVRSVWVWVTGVRGGGRGGWGGGVWAGAAGAETRCHGMRLRRGGLLHWDRNRDVFFSLSWLTWLWISMDHLQTSPSLPLVFCGFLAELSWPLTSCSRLSSSLFFSRASSSRDLPAAPLTATGKTQEAHSVKFTIQHLYSLI